MSRPVISPTLCRYIRPIPINRDHERRFWRWARLCLAERQPQDLAELIDVSVHCNLMVYFEHREGRRLRPVPCYRRVERCG